MEAANDIKCSLEQDKLQKSKYLRAEKPFNKCFQTFSFECHDDWISWDQGGKVIDGFDVLSAKK
jgi:hypothetical protein